jgi:hypothetical protein
MTFHKLYLLQRQCSMLMILPSLSVVLMSTRSRLLFSPVLMLPVSGWWITVWNWTLLSPSACLSILHENVTYHRLIFTSLALKLIKSPHSSFLGSLSTILSLGLTILITFRGKSLVASVFFRMWDMSALIRRCENFGHFYSFCSQLAEASERQT